MSIEVVTGTFEVHIFVAPLDPPPSVVLAFSEACRGGGEHPRMKGLLLHLDYLHRGFVGVLQSSRYVYETTIDSARREASLDAQILRAAGFEVLREKVEALATNPGVPKDAKAASDSPADRYFEFHLLIESLSGAVSTEDVVSLRGISGELGVKLGRPVPLSYNALKPGQRFLNLRDRGTGLTEARVHVAALEEAVCRTGALRVTKVISEYICSDSFRALDNGWLEPL